MHRAPTARPFRSTQAGFSLIELMVAVVVSGIVVAGIFAFSSVQRSNHSVHQRNVRIQQSLEGAMWAISQDLELAGVGVTRLCTELRIFDEESGRLINPGAPANPAGAMVDPETGEPYWVLRDGIQAHWNSTDGTIFGGAGVVSAAVEHASDSFDVLVGDPTYSETAGVFRLEESLAAGTFNVSILSGPALDSGNPAHVNEMRQLFPPGSFFVVTRAPGALGVRPETQGMCILLQVTGNVTPGEDGPQSWFVQISNTSGFNSGMATMLNDVGGVETCAAGACTDDFNLAVDNAEGPAGAVVVPLGRLRWSRYEIDYTVPEAPYLVRSDIIGWQPGDPQGLGGGVDYPGCPTGCRAPQLHLPGSGSPPVAVAIAPLVEDMQVAVGCDAYTAGAQGNQRPINALPPPNPAHVELGPTVGPTAGFPNRRVDENPVGNGRAQDEWLGNAAPETWGPDCVYYGTGEIDEAAWQLAENPPSPPPPYVFMMSPQTIRVTLVGSSEFGVEAGGVASAVLQPIEDRPALASTVGRRQRFTLTERFAPKNLRWRDPAVL